MYSYDIYIVSQETDVKSLYIFLSEILYLCLVHQELKQLADEVRSDIIFNVSKTGGHLGSSLGVVELTVALHYIFNCPQDRILWDVGHQVIKCGVDETEKHRDSCFELSF